MLWEWAACCWPRRRMYDHCDRAGLDVDDHHNNTYTINGSHRWVRSGSKGYQNATENNSSLTEYAEIGPPWFAVPTAALSRADISAPLRRAGG